MRYTALYMTRHNAIVARFKKAASTKFEVRESSPGQPGLETGFISKGGPKHFRRGCHRAFDNRLIRGGGEGEGEIRGAEVVSSGTAWVYGDDGAVCGGRPGFLGPSQ